MLLLHRVDFVGPYESFVAAAAAVASIIDFDHSLERLDSTVSIACSYAVANVRRQPMVVSRDFVIVALEIGLSVEAIADAVFVECAACEELDSLAVMNADRENRCHSHWPHISMDRLVQAHNAIAVFVMDVVQSAIAVAADAGDDEKHWPFAAAMGIDCLKDFRNS